MIGQLGKVEDLTTCFCLQSAKLPLSPASKFRHSLFGIADDHRNGGSIGVEDGLKLTGKKLQIAFDLLLPSPAVHRSHVDLQEDREAVPAFGCRDGKVHEAIRDHGERWPPGPELSVVMPLQKLNVLSCLLQSSCPDQHLVDPQGVVEDVGTGQARRQDDHVRTLEVRLALVRKCPASTQRT